MWTCQHGSDARDRANLFSVAPAEITTSASEAPGQAIDAAIYAALRQEPARADFPRRDACEL